MRTILRCWRSWTVLVLILIDAGPWPTSNARAQNCLREVEPNETPAQALAIGTAACIEGERADAGDTQDFYLWQVSEADAAKRWMFLLKGLQSPNPTVAIPTKAQFYRCDPGGKDVASPQPVLVLDSPDSGLTARDGLLVQPGCLMIAVVRGARGFYRLELRSDPAALPASGDREPNQDSGTASPTLGAFSLSGDLKGSLDEYRWAVSASDAAKLWKLSVQGPVGMSVHAMLSNDAGSVGFLGSPADGSTLTLNDLGLDAGNYRVVVGPPGEGPAPYILKAEPAGERAPDREAEPNDDPKRATPLAPATSTKGRLTGTTGPDFYRFLVDAALAAQALRIELSSASGQSRELCLLDGKDQRLQCRSGAGPLILADLVLPAGAHALSISGAPDPLNPYTIRLDGSGPPAAGHEREPNDSPKTASPLGEDHSIRGRSVGSETDVYRLTGDEKQLWSIEVEGEGLTRLSYLDGAGVTQREVQGSGQRLLRLSNLLLLPGGHLLSVQGTGGEYVLRALPLGLPDKGSEAEPNDDQRTAQRLDFDSPRTTLLDSPGDRDVYSFSLTARQYVALGIVPPPDGAVTVHLNWGTDAYHYVGMGFIPRLGGTVFQQGEPRPGEPIRYEALLEAGEYHVNLGALQTSQAPVKLLLERLDPFLLPADLEPNNSRFQARPLPATLQVSGAVGAVRGDEDWYRLPELQQATTAAITVEGQVQIGLWDHDNRLHEDLKSDLESKIQTAILPAGAERYLAVSGAGPYSLTLRYAAGPEPARDPGPLQAAVQLAFDAIEVAADWQQGQRVDGRLGLRNEGGSPLQLSLEALSSHHAWKPGLASSKILLQPGEQKEVAVQVEVLSDAAPDEPVQITVQALAQGGQRKTASARLNASRTAQPLHPHQTWAVPGALLGGLDAAALALGAQMVEPGGAPAEQQKLLHDGMAPPHGGMAWSTPLPATLTVRLAGDAPVPVAGFLLNPRSQVPVSRRLHRFDVLLSMDGTTFQEVLSGELDPLPVEQAFVLDPLIPARYAQLRLRSTYEDAGGVSTPVVHLGDWKVVASPGTPWSAEGLDLADPARGGHVVWVAPQFALEYEPIEAMLAGGAAPLEVQLGAGEVLQWTVGFHHQRAAQIAELRWLDAPAGKPERRLAEVDVSVSLESPIGPWTSLGRWALDREAAPGGPPPFRPDQPVWARYVRFTAAGSGKSEARELPGKLAILERATGEGYLSILGEWGESGRDSIYEQLSLLESPHAEPPAAVEGGSWFGGTRSSPPARPGGRSMARPLALGATARGQVQLGREGGNADWYAFDVPEGQNTLELRLGNISTLGVRVVLQDIEGTPVPLRLKSSSPAERTLQATVTPGGRVLALVDEPPRSLVLAWDSSGSLEQQLPVIYPGLARLAAEIRPGLETIQLVQFGAPSRLTDFSDQPAAIQRSINDTPRDVPSSDAEQALLESTRALAQREGTRAVLLITDGWSPGYAKTAELWRALSAVQPRIFALATGSQDRYAQDQDLMQTWAAVNGGLFREWTTPLELASAIDDAISRLRQPASYELVATASAEAPPEPGWLEVLPSAQPAQPAAATTPLVAAAAGIELILDASGSMRQKLEGRRRIDIAKDALVQMVTRKIPPGTPLAFRVFGHRQAGGCDTELVLPLRPLEPVQVSDLIQTLQSTNLAKTPIAASLRMAAQDLAAVQGPKIVVLLTDGEETCQGDPASEIRALAAQGLDVRVNIVGFAVDDPALVQTFRDWAALGKGHYFDAAGGAALGVALEQAVRPQFRVLDAGGKPVASGTVGGDAIQLPAGLYRVEVLTEPPGIHERVEVRQGAKIQLQIDGSGSSPP